MSQTDAARSRDGDRDGDKADYQIRWLNTDAAARRLGVTVKTLYRLINEGKVPAYKIGRVIRLQQAEVDEFIVGTRIAVGSLDRLYPEPKKDTSETDVSIT